MSDDYEMPDDYEISDVYGRIIQLEAKVHNIQNMMRALLFRLGIDPAEVAPPEPSENTRTMFDMAIRKALDSGNRKRAIVLYSSLYGVSLKDAKDAIDAMESPYQKWIVKSSGTTDKPSPPKT